MFSLIKKFQELIGKFKRKKGLWFTLLTTGAIASIFIFMYILMTLTSDVKDKVYNSINKDYQKSLENIFLNKKLAYSSILQALKTNDTLLTALEQNDQGYLSNYVNNLNKEYKKDNLNSIIINLYSAIDRETVIRNTISQTLRSKTEVFGIEVQQTGVYITLVEPIERNGNLLGLIEIKQSIHTLKNDFESNDNNFVFLLDKKMLSKLSLKSKSGRYRDVINEYVVYQSAYSSRFYTKITENGEINFKNAMIANYDSDNVYFRTYKKAKDINGADIGLFVVGESNDKNSGFINIADSMVKSVTSVALGLVISILLFMF